MEFNIIPDQEVLTKCALCHNHIGDDAEVFGAGVKLKQDMDLSPYERHCIQVDLISEEKPVNMMVTAQGSEAKEQGNDGMFMFCSETCAIKMKNIMEQEIAIGKMFEKISID